METMTQEQIINVIRDNEKATTKDVASTLYERELDSSQAEYRSVAEVLRTLADSNVLDREKDGRSYVYTINESVAATEEEEADAQEEEAAEEQEEEAADSTLDVARTVTIDKRASYLLHHYNEAAHEARRDFVDMLLRFDDRTNAHHAAKHSKEAQHATLRFWKLLVKHREAIVKHNDGKHCLFRGIPVDALATSLDESGKLSSAAHSKALYLDGNSKNDNTAYVACACCKSVRTAYISVSLPRFRYRMHSASSRMLTSGKDVLFFDVFKGSWELSTEEERVKQQAAGNDAFASAAFPVLESIVLHDNDEALKRINDAITKQEETLEDVLSFDAIRERVRTEDDA